MPTKKSHHSQAIQPKNQKYKMKSPQTTKKKKKKEALLFWTFSAIGVGGVCFMSWFLVPLPLAFWPFAVWLDRVPLSQLFLQISGRKLFQRHARQSDSS